MRKGHKGRGTVTVQDTRMLSDRRDERSLSDNVKSGREALRIALDVVLRSACALKQVYRLHAIGLARKIQGNADTVAGGGSRIVPENRLAHLAAFIAARKISRSPI